jgi:tetratricopeptide (TPR) repeat protein
MSPEQLSAFSDPAQWDCVDERADLYSLGLVLRELLIGQAPDLPNTKLPVLRAIRDLRDRREGFKPGLRAANPQIPHALESIAGRCLAYDPAERYASAADLADDLKRYLAHRPLAHAPNPSRRELVTNVARRFRVPLAACTLLAVGFSAVESDRWLHTIEHRQPFLSAVAAIDGEKYGDADRILESLETDGAKSPVILFQRAFVCLKVKRVNPNGAVDYKFDPGWWLARVWRQPAALESLLAWGKEHPGLSAQAVQLGDSLIEQLEIRDAAKKEAAKESAARTFDLALRLSPGNIRAQSGLGDVAEQRGDHAEARRILNNLLAAHSAPVSPEEPISPEERDVLRNSYNCRARVSTAMADNILKQKRGEVDLARADGLLAEALDDLKHSVELLGFATPDKTYLMDFITVRAKLGRGDVAARRGDHVEARGFYDAAKNLVERLSAPAGFSRDKLEVLAQEVAERIGHEAASTSALGEYPLVN